MVLELDFNIAVENLIFHFQTLERILWDGLEASGSSNSQIPVRKGSSAC